MTLPTVFWIAVLSLAPGTTEPWQRHEAECYRLKDAADYVGAADACRSAFEAVPDDPRAFDRRSLFVFSAVRLYKRAHQHGGDIEPLCTASTLLRTFAAQLDALPEGERPRDRADVAAELRELEARVGDACAGQVERDLVDGSAVDKPEPPASSAREQPPADARPTPLVRPPPPLEPTSAPPTRLDRRRPLRIAGGTTLGLGLGLGGAAIAMLARGAAMRAEVDGLNAAYPDGVMIPPAEAGRFHDAEVRGQRADRLAIGFGVPAVALVLSGVALLAIDVHRDRTNRRFALHPGLAGVRLTMEF